MKTYQIELNHGKGIKSWLYCSISESATQEEIEREVSKEYKNDYLKEIKSPILRFSEYKVSRIVLVREYHATLNKPVRKGHKFKMSC